MATCGTLIALFSKWWPYLVLTGSSKGIVVIGQFHSSCPPPLLAAIITATAGTATHQFNRNKECILGTLDGSLFGRTL